MAGEAVNEFYKQLDWDGWKFWHITYDIMDYEQTDKEHMLNNLLDGFMSRAGHTMKYTFGKLAVLGVQGSWEIKGVWLMRGHELPDGLVKEHAQWEYYKARAMDPRKSKEDDALVRAYFSAKGYQEKKIEGMPVNKVAWQK